ncbi:MAG: hypothetical protein V8S33_13695 [Intestinibacter bartlettii]
MGELCGWACWIKERKRRTLFYKETGTKCLTSTTVLVLLPEAGTAPTTAVWDRIFSFSVCEHWDK